MPGESLFAVLLLLCLQVEGFRNRQLVPLLAQMLGLPETHIRPGRVTYELRRLRLHGLIARIPKTHRYRLTEKGLATVVFYQRTYARLIRPGLSVLHGGLDDHPKPLASAFQKLINEIDANMSAYAA
jgi:DNA-binding PadR family transcriptional regulator